MTTAPPTVDPRSPAPPVATALLAVTQLTVRFGGITALDEVGFDVARHEVCALIGPNGAGKTTVFNCLSRVCDPVSGDLRLDGASLLALGPSGVARAGIGRTFQNLALFERLSALDNVLVGGHSQGRSGFVADALRLAATRSEERRLRDRAMEWLAFVGLADVAGQTVGDLPFGSRRRVELARALMGDPRLLLLDEPAAGLSLHEIQDLERLVRDVRDRMSISVLIVEHRMRLVLSLCDHVVVLDFGRVIADGPPARVAVDPAVVRAYLGADR